jgi:hypothetical protein
MSTGDIAFVREQGVDFAVVCVADHVVEGSVEREGVYQSWTMQLGLPVALMGANRHRVYGHKTIVRFVSSIDPRRLPWRKVGM